MVQNEKTESENRKTGTRAVKCFKPMPEPCPSGADSKRKSDKMVKFWIFLILFVAFSRRPGEGEDLKNRKISVGKSAFCDILAAGSGRGEEMKKPLEKSERFKAHWERNILDSIAHSEGIAVILYTISEGTEGTFSGFSRKQPSPTMRPFLPVAFVGLALGLTVLLGVGSLVGVVFVLGSARHAGGTLFCWILTDFHWITSFGSIIAHYKIKIKIRLVWQFRVLISDCIGIFFCSVFVEIHSNGIDLVQFV